MRRQMKMRVTAGRSAAATLGSRYVRETSEVLAAEYVPFDSGLGAGRD